MPRQNRVTPFSTLISTPARGTLTGNRGCLHDAQQQIRRAFQGQRWIICLLEFKGRKRTIMTPGQYTELFFLDEATAFAAGHRPCAQCQRERFERFRQAWAIANPAATATTTPAVTIMDSWLHRERVATTQPPPRSCQSIEELPDGVFITDDEKAAYLLIHRRLLLWTPAGYEPPKVPLRFPVRVLTPPSVVSTLAAGFPVDIHTSAF